MGEPDIKRAKVEDKVSKNNSDGKTESEKALEEIDKVQSEIDVLNEQASEEILKVEQKYNLLRKPYFEQRNNLIKHIPNFWVVTFANHPQISRIISEEEEECLQNLKKVEVEEFDDIKSGYRIKFTFYPNEFFENTEIIKEFKLSGHEPTSTTTEIKWKPDKKKLTNGRDDELPKSFFDWLCNNSDPISDDMAEVIKDDLWPNPLQYYLIPDLEDDGEDFDAGYSDENEELDGPEDDE